MKGCGKMKNEVLILDADDWEGMFVNGKLEMEGHRLNDGCSRKAFLSHVCKKYEVTLDEIKEGYVDDDYRSNILEEEGCFREDLSEVIYIIDD
jgi:hypothetical protein